MNEFYPSLQSEKKQAYINLKHVKIPKLKMMVILGYASALSVTKSKLIGEFDTIMN